ncbi:MAG: hypothetical protein QM790_03475 [Nibricoccus sp.]
MKAVTKRVFPLGFAVVLCVAGMLFAYRSFFYSPYEAQAAEYRDFRTVGAPFAIETLAAGDRIEVEMLIPGHRQSSAWALIIEKTDQVFGTVIEREADWSSVGILSAGKVLKSRRLKVDREVHTGFDILREVLRLNLPYFGYNSDLLRVTYYRAGKLVAEERHAISPEVTHVSTHEQLRPELQATTTPEKWDLLCKFLSLHKTSEDEEPNQALVPTPMPVTPAADAPVAPATGAAHL